MLVFAKLVTPTYKIVKKVEIGFLGLNYGVVSNWVKESVKLIYTDYIAINKYQSKYYNMVIGIFGKYD